MKKPTKQNREVKPLSSEQIDSNISILSYMKDSIFQGDHPGIDKIIEDMKQQPNFKKQVDLK